MFLLSVPLLCLSGPAVGDPQHVPVGPPPINLSHPQPPALPGPATEAKRYDPAAASASAAAAAQLPCPGPMTHPFQRLPRVCVVEPCPCPSPAGLAGAPGPCPDGSCAPGAAGAEGARFQAWAAVFHEAAHFPLPRFTADGHPVPLDGLLIYEGMRFTVYENGVYDVGFTATVPEMPVVVRLQLVLHNGSTGAEHRLTLPPIRLEPKPDVRPGDPTGNTFHVAHRGYSDLLVWRATQLGVTTGVGGVADWRVTRVGTARFGTAVAVSDPTR